MKVAIYSIKQVEKPYLIAANQQQHELCFTAETLSLSTINISADCTAVCCFITDCLSSDMLAALAANGVTLIALRSAGYDHIDLAAAKKCGLTVVRVPKYSAQAIAEFAVGLILILSRRIFTAQRQGLAQNFALDNLLGFNLCQKTVGIVGAGNIGTAFAIIMRAFGCRLLACDPVQNDTCLEMGVEYTSLTNLLKQSDIVSLHCLLNENTYHILDEVALAQMKPGALLINTGRGALVDTQALIAVLQEKRLGGAGLDVYEKESGLFFVDHSNDIIADQQFLTLQSLDNVIITPHQAFFTEEAIKNIASITIENITAFDQGNPTNLIR